MAFYPNNSMPPPVPAGTPRAQETVRGQRVNRAQYVGERLRNGIPPVAVALLTQLETQQTLPGMSLSIFAEVDGYRRTIVCQNNSWDGYDLTHQFLDERSIAAYGPSQGTTFEQEASLRMMPANLTTPQLPPLQMVSCQPVVPKPTPMTPDRAPHMIMQTTCRAPTSDRKPSGYRLPPLLNPDLTGQNPGAVIVALQAESNYPEPSDSRQAVQQRLPCLAAYLRTAAQPSGCEPQATPVESLPMEAETTAGISRNATACPSDEAGQKNMTQETTASTSAGMVTESPTSCPPPNKQRPKAPQLTLKSVVIPKP